jgi:competence protein ComEA
MHTKTNQHPRTLRSWIATLVASLALGATLAGSALPAAAAEGSSQAGVVNLNTANEEQLQRLPGVGEAKAGAIVEMRKRLDGFRHIRQLVRVRGIGRATFRRLRPMLTLEGKTTLK